MTHDSATNFSIESSTPAVSVNVTRYSGIGPDMLLIHGIGSSGADFNPILERLTEFCNPYVLDLRGHGGSDKPSGGYHYTDYVNDLSAVLGKLDLKYPIVLGHSLGGIIALMWAATNPDVASALIIEDSPLRSGDDFRDAFEGWLTLNDLPHEVAQAWYAEKNPHWSPELVRQRSFDMVNTARSAILELQATSLANEGLDSFSGLDSISVPLLFLQGDPEAGSMVHADDLSNLQRLIPQMGVKQFSGAGHTIHRSHPQEWLESVRKFVQTLQD